MPGGAPAGWYRDPTGRNAHRYWDGRAWTAAAGRAGRQVTDPMPPGLPSDQHAELAFTRTYLQGAAARGVISPEVASRLLADVDWWWHAPVFGPPEATECIEAVTAPTTIPAPAAPVPATAPGRPPVVAPPPPRPSAALTPPPGIPAPAPRPGPLPSTPMPSPADRLPAARPPVVGTREPGRLARWVKAVSSELAIHGLADLGVLLVFAGLFGFVAFAFGEVRVGLRPVAELAIPATFLGAGVFVRRRGTPLIGTALVFLGGALLPIVVIASMSDGASFPPDLTGAALPATLAASLVVIAALYVLAARHDPTTPLRFLVAPVLWLAVAAAGLGLGRSVPQGSGLASPSALQWSLVCLAVTGTIALARFVVPERWVAPLVVPAWAGLPLAYVVTLLAAREQGSSAPAVLLAGIAAIVGLELFAAGFRVDVLTGLQATVLVVTAWEMAGTWGAGWAALGAGLVAIAAAELRMRQHAPGAIVEMLLWGAALAIGLTAVDVAAHPWALVVGTAAAWGWALVRTHRPTVVPSIVTMVLLWVLPLGTAVGLTVAAGAPAAQLVLAGVLVVVAVGVRARPEGSLPLWDEWIPAAGAAMVAWLVSEPTPVSDRAIVAAALVTVAFALAPRWPTLRLWTTAAGATVAGGLVAVRIDARPDQVALALTGVALVCVAASELRRVRLWGHLGLIGELAALVAVGMAVWHLPEDGAQTPTWFALVLAGGAAAFATGAVVEEVRGSSVSDLLARWWALLQAGVEEGTTPSRPALLVRLWPLIVTVAVAPPAACAVLDASGVPEPGSAWIPVAGVALLALGGLLAHAIERGHRPAAAVLAAEGTVVGALGVLAVSVDDWPVVVALALLIVQVLVVGPRLRRGFMVWVAVVASDLLAGAVADLVPVDDAHYYLVPLVWGGALVVGGLLVARRTPGPLDAARWRRASPLAPVAVGSLTLLLGLVIGLAESPSAAAWASLIAAGFIAAASILVAASWSSTASWLLVTITVGHLVPVDPLVEPWVFVPWAALLLLAAEGLHRWAPSGRSWWRERWDVPPVIASAVVSVIALVLSFGLGWVPATWCGIGALALVVAIRIRWAPLAVLGTGAVLVGAGAAGPGWLALALAVVAAGSAAGVTRTSGTTQWLLRVAADAAATGSWVSFCVWRDWDVVPAAPVTAAVAGAVVLLAGLGRRARRLDDVAAMTLAVPALVATGAVVPWWLAAADPRYPSGLAVAGGVVLVALGFAAGARPFGWGWLRDASALAMAGAVGLLAPTLAATPDQVVAVASLLGVVGAVAIVGVLDTGRARPWLRSAGLVTGIAVAVSLTVSLQGSAGWRSLACLAAGAVSVLVGSRLAGPARTVLQVIAASAAVGAWASFGTWSAWSPQQWTIATAAVALSSALALAVVIRLAGLPRDWTLVIVAPIVVALGSASVLLHDPEVDRAIAGPWVAGAFAAAALAAATSARPARSAWLRELSAVLLLASGVLVLDSGDPTAQRIVIGCGIAAISATAALVVLGLVRGESVWTRPLEVVAIGALAGTWVGLASGDPGLAEVALLLTGAELAVLGVVRRRPLLLELAPSAFCVAWIVYAIDALGGDPGWFAGPVGLTLLATVSLARRQRRAEGLPAATELLAGLEIVGMVLLVISPLVRTISVSLAYAAVAVGLGIGLGLWGIATKVRQRLAGGAVTVTAAITLLLLVPLVDVARRATGPWLWLAIAAIGLVAIVVAAVLEQSRRAIRQTTDRLRDLTRDWE